MDELKKEYVMLFNGITDTIRQLETTIIRLKVLQARAEEAYLVNAESQETPAREAHEENREECEETGAVPPQ